MPGILKSKARSFRLVEAGCGKVPLGLLKKAQRSLERGKTNRQFIGVDETLDIDALLKKAKVKALPSNLRLVENCIVKFLIEAGPESQNVIFASYLNNILADKPSCLNPMYSCKAMFLGLAKIALKPGGKIVLIQDKAISRAIKLQAMHNGLHAHIIEIPQEVAKKSPAEYVRMRSTPLRRKIFMAKNKSYAKGLPKKEVKALMKEGVISSRQEFTKPVAIILTKPRSGERPEIRAIEFNNAMPLELRLVQEAIFRMRQ